MTGYRHGTEPRLEDMISDPIVHLVMRRDRISVEDVRAVVDAARRRLRLRACRTDGTTPTAL